MKFPAWVFITNNTATIIHANHIKDATSKFLTDWDRNPWDLEIYPVTGSG